MSVRDLAQRAIVMKHIADVTAGEIANRRKELAEEMANGDRTNVSDPEDSSTDLGYVLRTKTKGSATVSDRDKFTAWVAEAYPDRIKYIPTIADLTAAVEVLQEHAPHLLDVKTAVEPWAEHEILLLTAKAKQPCGPGGEVGVPGVIYEPPKSGTINVKVSEEAPEVFGRLWRQGRIDLHTGEILPKAPTAALEAP